MIDRFNSWLTKKNGKNSAPMIVGTDIKEFERESIELLSYLLDMGILFNIETYGYHYKIVLSVDDVNENCDTIKFSTIKDDFIQYITYIGREYIIDQETTITYCDEDFTFRTKTCQNRDLENLDDDIEVSNISFYLRK